MTYAHALIRNALGLLFTVIAFPVFAQGTQSLAKEAKNPFADLINLQLFYDANLRVGAANETQQVLIIQPLIPFELNTDWTLITRTILPLIAQPGPAPGEAWIRGLADTQFAAFLSPAQAGTAAATSHPRMIGTHTSMPRPHASPHPSPSATPQPQRPRRLYYRL